MPVNQDNRKKEVTGGGKRIKKQKQKERRVEGRVVHGTCGNLEFAFAFVSVSRCA